MWAWMPISSIASFARSASSKQSAVIYTADDGSCDLEIGRDGSFRVGAAVGQGRHYRRPSSSVPKHANADVSPASRNSTR
jgi:hypothetical protein